MMMTTPDFNAPARTCAEHVGCCPTVSQSEYTPLVVCLLHVVVCIHNDNLFMVDRMDV